MSTTFITTNVRLPRSLHKTLKRRAVEEEKSFAELVRDVLVDYNQASAHEEQSPKKLAKTIADLAELAEPMGGDLSSNIDAIVYGTNNR